MENQTYDTLLLPTGETTAGDETSFPVSRKAIELFKSGRFGSIFITGGYGGFADRTLSPRTEAEITRDFMISQGIPEEKIYWDGQSLDTLGNFTFPIYEQEGRNPNLLHDFSKILVLGKEGHMWRARDYASLMPFEEHNKILEFQTIPGRHNDGQLSSFYHKAFMNVLNQARIECPEKVHEFLKEEHPFYSQGWFFKGVTLRKIESLVKVISWNFK